MMKYIMIIGAVLILNGCAVVTVASTAVSVTSTVVGTAVDVTAAGVRAVIPD